MDIVSRLKEFISHLQTPVTQFADTSNIPRPTLSQLLNGRNKKVSDEIITKIHHAYPQLNVLWLLFGEGDMIVNNSILNGLNSTATNESSDVNSHNINQFASAISFSEDERSEDSNNSTYADATVTSSAPLPESDTTSFIVADSDNQGVDADITSGASHYESRSDAGMSSQISGVDSSSSILSSTPEAGSTLKTISFDSSERRIKSIIVYYTDNSFESFVPEQHSTQQ